MLCLGLRWLFIIRLVGLLRCCVGDRRNYQNKRRGHFGTSHMSEMLI